MDAHDERGGRPCLSHANACCTGRSTATNAAPDRRARSSRTESAASTSCGRTSTRTRSWPGSSWISGLVWPRGRDGSRCGAWGRRFAGERRPRVTPVRHNRLVTERQRRLRILLVDDHRVVRAGLRMLLDAEPDLEVVDEAGDVRDAVFKARRHTPDLIVLDVKLPDGDGDEAIGTLQAEAPDAKVLILS